MSSEAKLIQGVIQNVFSNKRESTKTPLTFLAVVCMAFLSFVGSVQAGAPQINTLQKEGVFGKFKHSGIAIRGYDTVAYFTQGKPVKGDKAISTEWNGAMWLFSSEEHKNLFVAQPEKYAPQYGGYCAYGVANDYLVKIEPEQWQIVDDQLYLNFSKDIQARWVKDISGYIKRADRKFEALLAQQKS